MQHLVNIISITMQNEVELRENKVVCFDETAFRSKMDKDKDKVRSIKAVQHGIQSTRHRIQDCSHGRCKREAHRLCDRREGESVAMEKGQIPPSTAFFAVSIPSLALAHGSSTRV